MTEEYTFAPSTHSRPEQRPILVFCKTLEVGRSYLRDIERYLGQIDTKRNIIVNKRTHLHGIPVIFYDIYFAPDWSGQSEEDSLLLLQEYIERLKPLTYCKSIYYWKDSGERAFPGFFHNNAAFFEVRRPLITSGTVFTRTGSFIEEWELSFVAHNPGIDVYHIRDKYTYKMEALPEDEIDLTGELGE